MRSLWGSDRPSWVARKYENDYANQRTQLRSGFRAAADEVCELTRDRALTLSAATWGTC
jgi:hypothetical protein